MYNLEIVPENPAFSKETLGLQLAWDSTSLGNLKTCARLYYYTNILGLVPREENVHFIFGLVYHSSLEIYDHSKSKGKSHEEALQDAVIHCLSSTWNARLNRPWLSDHTYKNRKTLLRTVVWYLDYFKDDPLVTVILHNGKPAIELSFSYESGQKSTKGEPFIMCGHLDKLALLTDQIWIVDRKTTIYALDDNYFQKYTPDNQVSTYCFSAPVVYKVPAMGLIIDAVQVQVTGSRFKRSYIERSQTFLDEWYEDTSHWFRLAEYYAKANYWPMNDKACGMYGGCAFRSLCSKSPGTREGWYKKFAKRVWNPLEARGNV